MKFITLTRTDGVLVVVNAKQIQTMVAYEGFTSICFRGTGAAGAIDVQESVAVILADLERR